MLLQRNQRAQAGWGQLVKQQESAGPVAREVFVATRIGLAQHQRLRLCQRIGQQQRLVAGQLMPGQLDRHKFHRYHVGALVQHLKISVLAVGTWLAPKHGRGGKGQRVARSVHPLAVALHLQLLQISRQPAQGAVVGRNAAAAEPMKIAVPDVDQGQAHRKVVLELSFAEMLVHVVSPSQKVPKTRCANCYGKW